MTKEQIEAVAKVLCRESFGDQFDSKAAQNARIWECWMDSAQAVLEAAEHAAWQPIETAPPEKMVLVCVAAIERHRLVIGLLSKDGIWLDEMLRPMRYPPTHWRPLPSRPEQKS